MLRHFRRYFRVVSDCQLSQVCLTELVTSTPFISSFRRLVFVSGNFNCKMKENSPPSHLVFKTSHHLIRSLVLFQLITPPTARAFIELGTDQMKNTEHILAFKEENAF